MTVPVFAARSFTVNQLTNASAYLAVFDKYRIRQVECWMESELPTGAGSLPLYTAVDLDDAVAPTSVTNVADKQGAVVGNSAAGHYHRWMPNMALAAYSGAFTSFTSTPATWVDSASPNVQHYGLKIAAEVDTVQNTPFSLTVRMVVEFASPGL